MAAFVAGCNDPTKNPAVSEDLPYCFIDESADIYLGERIGKIAPIALDEVLLFPVVENGVIQGKPVSNGIGSPVVYRPGSDIRLLQFPGIERWSVKRYMVMARGYYFSLLPRMFVFTDTVWGKKCNLAELTPLMPGTDRRQFAMAALNALRSGTITVTEETTIDSATDYSAFFRASELKSWQTSKTTGWHPSQIVWTSPGSKVELVLTEGDFEIVERYLIGGEEKAPNQPPLQTPASGTPAANAPVAPPSGAAGR